MPVTARLSRKFNDRLGEDIANELVEWFNAVDATYRADLRELNELNFARFDAKLEQRFAQLEAKWEQRFAQVEAKWEQRFAQLDARIDQLATKLELLALETKFEKMRNGILAWNFAFWITTMLAIFGSRLLK